MKSKDLQTTYKVRLRGGFSDRNNISRENREMQYNSLDDRTKTMLINMTSFILHDIKCENEQLFYKSMIIHVFAFEFDISQTCDIEEVKKNNLYNYTRKFI